MADTWDILDPRRPRARPNGLAPEQLRPHARPEALTGDTRAATLDDRSRPHLRPEGLGTVPEETQEKATLPEAIPLDRLALVGLFDGPDGGSALLRLPSGSIVKVAAGGLVDGGRVTAISQDGLRLQKGDEEIVLTMPG